MNNPRTQILNNKQIGQRIDRIACQIYENNFSEQEILLAGISKNGFLLAKRLSEKVEEISPLRVKLAEIILNKKNPLSEKIKVTCPEKEWNNKVIYVVDDVLESGRTMLYAISPFLKHPVKRLHTIVLVNRAHQSFPVKADFVGISLATTMQEHVAVELNGTGKDAVYLM